MGIKNVLVTGGAGFIGSHLCPRLVSSGYKTRILDNLSPQVHGNIKQPPAWIAESGCEFIKGSVTSRKDLGIVLQDIDAVVHLAAETGTAQSMYEIAHYNQVNSQGTALLLDLVANNLKYHVHKILLASSRAVYGEGAYVCNHCDKKTRLYPGSRSAAQLSAQQWDPLCPSCGTSLTAVPTRESDRANPASIYAATKYAQEHLLTVTCGATGTDFGIFRLQNVYGEGQSLQNPYTGLLSIFSTRIRRGLPLPLFEDGEESRDFIHVDDVARVFLTALSSASPPDCIVNVGTGIKTSVKEIAASLSRAFGVPPDLQITGEYRLGDVRHNFADITRLGEVLGCRPVIDLAAGVDRFVKWVGTQALPKDSSERANRELRKRKLMK